MSNAKTQKKPAPLALDVAAAQLERAAGAGREGERVLREDIGPLVAQIAAGVAEWAEHVAGIAARIRSMRHAAPGDLSQAASAAAADEDVLREIRELAAGLPGRVEAVLASIATAEEEARAVAAAGVRSWRKR